FDDRMGAELVNVHAQRNLTKLVKLDETEVTGHDRVIRVGRRLTLTTGKASIILDGAKIRIKANGKIEVASRWNDVILKGSPRVMLNPPRKKNGGRAAAKAVTMQIHDARVETAWGDERYGDGVVMRGSGEFRAVARASLDRLMETRTGRAVLRKI